MIDTNLISKALEKISEKYKFASLWIFLIIIISTPEPLLEELNILILKKNYIKEIYLLIYLMSIYTIIKIVCFFKIPAQKTFFPVRDIKSRIKQSRYRYAEAIFKKENNEEYAGFFGATSNGDRVFFYKEDGKRIFSEVDFVDYKVIGNFDKHPKWERIDWQDVFNGTKESGVWAITERE